MAGLSVLIVGSGGREHALAWAMSRSPQVGQIFVAPGNAGTAALATNVPIAAADTGALATFAGDMDIGLTVVGPEMPLAEGIVDQFQAAGLTIFGPTRYAAQLESSKAFARQFLRQNGIPSPSYEIFDDFESARQYVSVRPAAVVVKASGLAAGKGVIVCEDEADAEAALHHIMVERAFGPAGDQVVIEERLRGPELSLLAFSDGRTVVPMLPVRDHKRALDHDLGPNTGGMGAFAPPPDVDQALVDELTAKLIQPTVNGMAARGFPYVGVLYAGIMLTNRGARLLEFNCRFGDPESQVILPMLEGDLAEIMLACIQGRLEPGMVRRRPGAGATVIMAAPGYPGKYARGLAITGLEQAAAREGVHIFHAGTRHQQGQLVSDGGRVLAVTATGPDLAAALSRAYAAVGDIHFEGAHYRRDIGATWLRRERP
jgi:phosphoribosylamine--glycine ligase